MDNDVFDGLARRLANRRGAVQALTGLLALPAAGLAAPTAGARRGACRRPGQSCSRQRACCEGARCARGTCKCKAGYTPCGPRCVDLARDAAHCGACNNRCPQGKTCNGGVCCEPGHTVCFGTCCASGEACVPAHDDLAATCCPESLVFVLCPDGSIVVDPATDSSYCNMPEYEIISLEQTCCPASSVCPGDGLCCVDPDTNAPVACNADGFCTLRGVSPATYTPPIKRRN